MTEPVDTPTVETPPDAPDPMAEMRERIVAWFKDGPDDGETNWAGILRAIVASCGMSMDLEGQKVSSLVECHALAPEDRLVLVFCWANLMHASGGSMDLVIDTFTQYGQGHYVPLWLATMSRHTGSPYAHKLTAMFAKGLTSQQVSDLANQCHGVLDWLGLDHNAMLALHD